MSLRNQAGLKLTPRQRQLVALLIQGQSVKQASETLGLAYGTVKIYMERARHMNHMTLLQIVHELGRESMIAQLFNLRRSDAPLSRLEKVIAEESSQREKMASYEGRYPHWPSMRRNAA